MFFTKGLCKITKYIFNFKPWSLCYDDSDDYAKYIFNKACKCSNCNIFTEEEKNEIIEEIKEIIKT